LIVAEGSGDVVVIARFTGRVKGPETELLLLSLTVTVKVESTDDDVGFPVNTPPALMLSQLGRPDADQEYGEPAPPMAANVWL
jgi:hypothetical protein